MQDEHQLLRLKEIRKITGISRTTLLAMIKAGSFPRGRKISARLIVWTQEAVQDWIKGKSSKDREESSWNG